VLNFNGLFCFTYADFLRFHSDFLSPAPLKLRLRIFISEVTRGSIFLIARKAHWYRTLGENHMEISILDYLKLGLKLRRARLRFMGTCPLMCTGVPSALTANSDTANHCTLCIKALSKLENTGGGQIQLMEMQEPKCWAGP
jgi:hypothetical protein